MMALGVLFSVLMLGFLGGGCTADGAKDLYETAQFEERQNNQAHAKQLYQDITEKYPASDYARKAEERLRDLNRSQ
jgi:outer membrane protein assembly factor BamD (BamD/ComL family)